MKKLSWKEWVNKNYIFHGDYYTSKQEIEDGMAYTDLSHYTTEEIEDLFSLYIKQKT